MLSQPPVSECLEIQPEFVIAIGRAAETALPDIAPSTFCSGLESSGNEAEDCACASCCRPEPAFELACASSPGVAHRPMAVERISSWARLMRTAHTGQSAATMRGAHPGSARQRSATRRYPRRTSQRGPSTNRVCRRGHRPRVANGYWSAPPAMRQSLCGRDLRPRWRAAARRSPWKRMTGRKLSTGT